MRTTKKKDQGGLPVLGSKDNGSGKIQQKAEMKRGENQGKCGCLKYRTGGAS